VGVGVGVVVVVFIVVVVFVMSIYVCWPEGRGWCSIEVGADV